MNELQVIEYQNQRVLTTQQLAQAYETESKNITQNFSRNEDRFINGRDYYLLEGEELKAFKSETSNSSFAPNINKLYLWTQRGANRHSKILDTDKAWQQFDLLEETYFQVKTGQVANIPKSLPEALRAYANEVESHEKTKLELIEAKPKVLFADSVRTSHTSILIGELAKILKQNGVDIGQNRLFEWLRTNGYLINRKGTDYNMPTQKAMNLELFKIKETTVNHSDGHITVNKTPKITGKGQIYFVNKFLESKN